MLRVVRAVTACADTPVSATALKTTATPILPIPTRPIVREGGCRVNVGTLRGVPKLKLRPLSQEELIEVEVLLGPYEQRRAALRHLRTGTFGAPSINTVNMEFGWNFSFTKGA